MTGQDPMQGTSAFNRHANPGALVFEQAGLLEAVESNPIQLVRVQLASAM